MSEDELVAASKLLRSAGISTTPGALAIGMLFDSGWRSCDSEDRDEASAESQISAKSTQQKTGVVRVHVVCTDRRLSVRRTNCQV